MSDGIFHQAKNEADLVTPEMAKAGADVLASWEPGTLDAELDSFGVFESPYHSLARLVFQQMMLSSGSTEGACAAKTEGG